MYRDITRSMFSLHTWCFIVGLILLRIIGLCCTEMSSLCYLSALRDFYTAVSPVLRTVFSYTRKNSPGHDISCASDRKGILSQALFKVIKNAGISAFTRGCRADRNITSNNQFAR